MRATDGEVVRETDDPTTEQLPHNLRGRFWFPEHPSLVLSGELTVSIYPPASQRGCVGELNPGASLLTFHEGNIVEVRILDVGHSRSRARASYPSCVTAYPRGSRSRVFSKTPS